MNDHKFPFENIDFNDLKWSEMMAIWRASLMFKPRSLGFVSWRWGYIDHTYSTGDFVRISPIKSEMAPFYGYGQVMALTNRPTNGQPICTKQLQVEWEIWCPKARTDIIGQTHRGRVSNHMGMYTLEDIAALSPCAEKQKSREAGQQGKAEKQRRR